MESSHADNGVPLRWAVFGTAPWGRASAAPEGRFARWLLGKGHEVAYVAPPHSPLPAWPKSERARRRAAWMAAGPMGRWRNGRLFSFVPRTFFPVGTRIPFSGDAARKASERFSRPRAGETLRDAGFARVDVLVQRSLEMPHLVRHLQPRLVVFAMEGDGALSRHAKSAILDADLVTAATEAAAEMAREAGAEHVHVAPASVDFAAWKRPGTLPPRPAELPPGPVAFVAEEQDAELDVELLAEVADRLPGWSFVLAGSRGAAMAALPQRRNILTLDTRPRRSLAQMLWHGDVGIAPFRSSRTTAGPFPRSIVEMIAAGLPMAATRLGNGDILCPPLRFAEGAADFADAIVAAAGADASRWARALDRERQFRGLLGTVRSALAEVGG